MTTEESLERLERELRRTKKRVHLLSAVFGLGLGAVIVLGTLTVLARGFTFKEVCAKRFVLKGSGGEPGAKLTVDKFGPMLYLYDNNGQFRAVLGVNNDGDPGLRFLDEKGKTRLGIAVWKEGPVLALFDGESNKSRVVLKFDDHGPVLQLGDEKGFIRAALSAPEEGPRLYLSDENGRQRARISVGHSLGTELILWDEDGKRVPIR